MAALIGALRVSLSAETSSFEQGMKKAQRTAAQTQTSLQKSLGGISSVIKGSLAGLASGLSIGLFVDVVKGALDYAGSLGELSQQIGVTTRDLQVLRYAAGQNGVAQEDLEKGLSKLTITLGQVAAGAKAPTAALKAIGIEAKDLAGLDAGSAFRVIADGLKDVDDRAQRAAIEVALFGKAGAKLDNLLSGGSQGINELAAAADRLGIVLSDEQIQKADATADKLAAVQTVLQAKIAGVVADNADSILSLANALADAAGAIVRIGGALASFANSAPGWAIKIANASNQALIPLQSLLVISRMLGSGPPDVATAEGQTGRSVAIPLGAAKKKGGGGKKIGNFLAGGGGGGSKKSRKSGGGGGDDATRAAMDSLRDSARFNDDLRRAQMDVLRATQDLSTDYTDRGIIAIQLLDLDKQSYEADLKLQTELFKLSKGKEGLSQVQADQLKLEYDKRNQLERDKVLADEQADRREDYNRLDQVDFDIQRDKLESQRQLAQTASEQRAIQLRILDLAYKQEKAKLEAILADEQATWAAKEEARRRLNGLKNTYANDRAGVMQQTQGPWESYLSSLPDTAAKWQEALENVRVDGFKALEDGIVGVIDGTKSLSEAFSEMTKQILADLVRIMIQKAITFAIGNIFGGGGISSTPLAVSDPGSLVGGIGSGSLMGLANAPLPGFATGGSFEIGGNRGRDMNMLSLNGLPIAKVSYGERLSIGKDGGKVSGGGMTVNAPITIMGHASRETTAQMSAAMRRTLADTAKKGY